MDPVPDSLLLRKSGSQNLCPLYHRDKISMKLRLNNQCGIIEIEKISKD